MSEDEQLRANKETAREHFLNLATNDAQKIAIDAAFDKPLREFTRDSRSIVDVSGAPNEGCPKGWIRCADGDCVPPGTLC